MANEQPRPAPPPTARPNPNAAPAPAPVPPPETDPVAKTVASTALKDFLMQDFNDADTGDPVMDLLPKTIYDVPVTYFKWSPTHAAEIEPLFKYAKAVTKDGEPAFRQWLPESMFAGGKDYVQQGQTPGCLYAGELMVYWVPSHIVAQKYKMAMKDARDRLMSIVPRKQDAFAAAERDGHSKVEINGARIGVHEVTPE